MSIKLQTVSTCRNCTRRLLGARDTLSQQPLRSYSRPSNAPKPQLDIKHIRQNPGLYEQNCIDRNYKSQARHSWRILELHKEWQESQGGAKELRERQNALKKKLSRLKDEEPEIRETILQEARDLKAQLSDVEQREDEIQSTIQSLALELPNLSSTQTPMGSDHEVVAYVNEHPDNSNSPESHKTRSHTDIGERLNLLNFTSSATTSGWGWYYLLNSAALLEQALVQYAIYTCIQRGWKLVSPPSMVYEHMSSACGFQPRDQNGETQVYSIEQPAKNQAKEEEKQQSKPRHVLTGTSEIPLAALNANTVFEPEKLPLKVVGVSRCYRAEAGARGVDTKGLYRVHEFTKVELFAWTMPDEAESQREGNFATSERMSHSEKLFEEMVDLQKTILQPLGLHCRMLSMPSTDLGASATRKIDIEAFFPSRRSRDDGWGEVTSASICTDYQSRRLSTKVKSKSKSGTLDFVHTLNGTAMAIPRVLAALLENGWDEQRQEVRVPEALRQWMGGKEWIGHE